MTFYLIILWIIGITRTGLAVGSDYSFAVEAGDVLGHWATDGSKVSIRTKTTGFFRSESTDYASSVFIDISSPIIKEIPQKIIVKANNQKGKG